MSYYDLPLLILNKKLTFIRLSEKKNNVFQSNPAECTIIPRTEGKLLLFRTVSNVLTGHTGKDDLPFYIHEIKKTGDKLAIFLKEGKEEPSVAIIPDKIALKNNTAGQYLLEYNESKDLKIIAFHFETVNGKTYEGEKKIHFAKPDSIYHIAIDFGSEASQMTVHRKTDERLKRHSLTSSLNQRFYTEKLVRNDRFHQSEDNELYRSLFYIKTQDSIFDFHQSPGTEDELVPLLTRVLDSDRLHDHYRLVSNLKIANMGAYNFDLKFARHYKGLSRRNFDDMVAEVQQKILNGFLHSALSEIRSVNHADEINIQVRLLMPNVLSQHRISNLIHQTNLFISAVSGEYDIAAHEVFTISESDASFLGYWWDENAIQRRKPNSRFIIIDMGKGTTDFSVISSDIHSNLTSEFRSGFVGAGNVITYAFVETIFTLIFGKDEHLKRTALKKYLLNDAKAFQLEFLDFVERIKANFRTNGVKPLKNLEFSENVKSMLQSKGDLGTITDSQILEFLREIIQSPQGTIMDEYGYIDDAINKLISTISAYLTNYLTHNQSLKIILTGRSFLFSPLLKTLRDTFISRNIEVEVLDNETDKTRLKKICLEGAHQEMIINHDSNLAGFPFVVAEDLAKEIRNSDSKKYTERISLLRLLFPTGIDEEELLPEDKLNSSGHLTQTERIAVGKFKLNNMFNPNTDYVYTSGNSYRVALNKSGDCYVYFDGEKLFIRTDNERAELETGIHFALTPEYLFETLFPFNSSVEEAKIKVHSNIGALPAL